MPTIYTRSSDPNPDCNPGSTPEVGYITRIAIQISTFTRIQIKLIWIEIRVNSTVAIKSAVDAWDVLQCSKAVAKSGLHQTVKVACSSM